MTNTVLRLFNRTAAYKKIDDIVTHKEINALSLEVTGYTGALIQIMKDDNTDPLDIYPLASGLIDTQAIIDHAGVNTYEVSIVYGQKLFSDLVATFGNRADIVKAGVLQVSETGYPAIDFTGFQHYDMTLPYAAATNPITISAVFSSAQISTTANIVVGQDNFLRGFVMVSNGAGKMAPSAYRTSGSIQATTTTTIANNETVYFSQIATRTGNVSGYLNGVLDGSSADANFDFTMQTKLRVGKWGGFTALVGKVQYIAISLTDDSAHQPEINAQLNSRYNIDGTNAKAEFVNTDTTGVYISETPAILPNGESSAGRIVGDINYSEFINFFAWTNLPKSSIGNIDISNTDSAFNSLVTGDFNHLDLFDYDKESDTLTQFASSEVKNIGYIERGRVRVTALPVQEKLNLPLPTGRFDSTYPNLLNEKKLLCLGACSLVAPKILDAATNKYFVMDNIYNVDTVYDQGKTVLFTQDTDGFTLTSNPSGKILCHVEGFDNGAASPEVHFSEHIDRLMVQTGISYNNTDLTTIHPTIDSSWSGTEESIGLAVTELVNGFNTYFYFEATGLMRFGLLENPTTPTGTLNGNQVIGEIKAFKDNTQVISETLLNDRNYNQYSDSEIVYTALEADKINFVKIYGSTTIGSGLDDYYKINNPDMVSQSVGGQTAGQVILDERIALWSTLRFFYTLTTVEVFSMNQVVTVTDTLKGLENGKDLLIIGKGMNNRTNKIDYWAWG